MDQQFEHLSDAQIERYGDRNTGAGPGFADRESDQAIETHLAACADCRARLLQFHRSRLGLMKDLPPTPALRPQPPGSSAPTPDCPPEDTLRDLAAGLSSPADATRLTQHAAQCDHCGPILRACTEDFADDLSPEDEALLAQLKSSSPSWQKDLAQQMAGAVIATPVSSAPINSTVAQAPSPVIPGLSTKSTKSISRLGIFRIKWLLVPATAIATAVIAFVIWNAQRETPEKVEKLLARAYTEQRTMEMRWPGAEYAPMRVTRGTEESRFDKPPSLLEAEGIIGRNERENSNDTRWLQAKAHAELLEHQPDAAIAGLSKALEYQLGSAPLKLSLAIAYVQRGDSTRDTVNYAHAIDLLSGIVRQKPINRVAMFDLALTYMKMEMWDKAAAEWELYLGFDANSPWADEARRHLQECKSKLHARNNGPPSTDPAWVTNASLDDVDYEIENYQDVALRSWLPTALQGPESTTRPAILKLAGLLNQKHSDPWLLQLLRDADRTQLPGFTVLSSAMEENAEGQYQQALQSSLKAQRFFEIRGNNPGRLRAQFEAAYAEQRLLRGADCASHATALQAALAPTNYAWLKSQVHLERAICLNFIGKLSEAGSELAAGFRIAEQSHFPVLGLRNIGISQGLEIQQGRYPDAWQDGLRGFDAYWSHPLSAQRLYQFYVSLALAAERMNLWSAADDLQRNAIAILQNEPDKIQLGAARLELAKILTAEKDDAAAEQEYLAADSLFQSQSSEETSRSYLLVGKIGLAELQLRRNDPKLALKTLEPVQPLLPRTNGYFIPLHYYQVLGNCNLKLRDLDKASEAYKQAIVIAERSLPQLRNDEKRLEWIRVADDAYRGLTRVFVEQNRQHDALSLWESYKSRPSYETSAVAPNIEPGRRSNWAAFWPVTSGAYQQQVGVEIFRIVYAVFDDGVQIWSLYGNSLESTWVPVSREQIQTRIRDFSRLCAHQESSLLSIHALGQNLFQTLLQPLGRLPASAVVVVELDRTLNSLPMEALRGPDGHYFGEMHPLLYSPGMIRENLLRSPRKVKSQQSLLLLDAARNYPVSFLPGHDSEREKISHLFTNVRAPNPAYADHASVRSLLAASDVFDFIGHGEPNGSGTALRVSPSLLLRAEDFSPGSLHRLNLAVLAACDTEAANDAGLLDTSNLIHAFLDGGVPMVVATQWNVDSSVTSEFMTAFYAHLLQNEPAPNALFAARSQILKRHDHPYFWSGFTITGKAN